MLFRPNKLFFSPEFLTGCETIDFRMLRSKKICLHARKDTDGGKKQKSLEDKYTTLMQEFTGASWLGFLHAMVIVSIRRDINTEVNVMRFFKMWEMNQEFLLKSLNTRWLISACDTIMDHSKDANEQLSSLAASLFINTIKLYETERVALDVANLERSYADRKYSEVGLFDGMTGFNIGEGDMIHNLFNRTKCIVSRHEGECISAGILGELVDRTGVADTVFLRFSSAHKNNRTSWV